MCEGVLHTYLQCLDNDECVLHIQRPSVEHTSRLVESVVLCAVVVLTQAKTIL